MSNLLKTLVSQEIIEFESSRFKKNIRIKIPREVSIWKMLFAFLQKKTCPCGPKSMILDIEGLSNI